MSIKRKVKAVERVFKSLDEQINQLKISTSLHCIAGCGKCCFKEDIEASPVEFLPLAYHWFEEGLALDIYERIQHASSKICINYAPLTIDDYNSGNCHSYHYRGLICRIFGYGATRDKLGMLRFTTCRLIKETQPTSVLLAEKELQIDNRIPVFADYYKKLYQIDFKLASQLLPINQAIKTALEEVMQYYAYRPFRSGRETG